MKGTQVYKSQTKEYQPEKRKRRNKDGLYDSDFHGRDKRAVQPGIVCA